MTAINEIRDLLELHVGRRVRIIYDLGRSKNVKYFATITGCYPNVFSARVELKRGRTRMMSYSYVDVLTGVVQLFEVDTGEQISMSSQGELL